MLIHEASKKCGLTRKAIEYYVDQKLVLPQVLENGYRDFAEANVEKLKKIASLRRLGVPVQSIREILDGEGLAVLCKVSERKKMEIEAETAKQALLDRLYETQDWDDVYARLDALEKNQTVLRRLLDVFPGYYGKYIKLHFGRFLNEPVLNAEQQEAYNEVVAFLDNMRFDLPKALVQYLDEITKDLDEAFFSNVSSNMDEMISNPQAFLTKHRECMEEYKKVTASDEFRTSTAFSLREALTKLNSENGYNDVFIPAMKKLSPAYRAYHEGLQKANELFLHKM